jgi:hypothetical protein
LKFCFAEASNCFVWAISLIKSCITLRSLLPRSEGVISTW